MTEDAPAGSPMGALADLLRRSETLLRQQDWHNSYLKAGCYHPPKSRLGFCDRFDFSRNDTDNLVDLFTEMENLSADLYESGNPRESAECAQIMTLMAPTHKDGYLALYRALLAIGRFKEAGDAYLTYSDYIVQQAGLSIPFWRGQDLTGKSLGIFAGAGIGDTLQNIRFLRKVARLCDRIIFYVKQPIWKLIGDIDGIEFRNLEPGKAGIDRHTDYICPLYTLPFTLGVTPYSLNRDMPCLRADPARVTRWDRALPPTGLRVGIVWQPAGPPGQGRTIPLASFAPLARLPDVHLISLHLDSGLEQRDDLPEGMRVTRLGPDFDSGPDALLDTVAVMQTLDLVLTCDTSLGHVAGCSGRPVWLLLHSIPDSRWMLDRDVTTWYPTMRLFVQSAHGDWDGVMRRVAAQITQMMAHV